MKKKLVRFFNNPKAVAIVSLVIAIPLSIYGYVRITRVPAYTYATATAGTIAQSGGAQSVRDLTLGFVSGGRIASVPVTVGQKVKKGDVLASLESGTSLGALSQAKAAYATAVANYDKVINGATGPAIDVAKAAVNTATVNLSEATKQQATLVENAHRTLLNSTPAAESDNTTLNQIAPVISGTYSGDAEGEIDLVVHQTNDGGYFTFSGLASGMENTSATVPQPIGSTGLFALFPTGVAYGSTWHINLPNTKAANYLVNYNAYQAALQTQSQVLASAQSALDQANANLASTVSTARPEDVASAQALVENANGALQIAQAAYSNTIITAPGDGTVTAISVAPGQVATPNAPAIEVLASTSQKNVAVMVPNSAIYSQNGISYVLKKSGSDVVQQTVTLGASDATNVEITSGLAVGDQVVTH